MSSTIETLHNNILTKIEYLFEMIEYLKNKIQCKQKNLDDNNQKSDKKLIDYLSNINNLENEIQNIYDLYCLNSIDILNNYYSLDKNNIENELYIKKKNYYNNQYYNLIKRESIQTNFDKIYSCIINILDNLIDKSNNKKLKISKIYKETKIFFDYNNISIHINDNNYNLNNDKCNKCNTKFILINNNELSCPICGKCKELNLYIIDDDDELQKYGSYDPIKHCKEWLDRIQGKEISDMTLINKITIFLKNKFKEDNIYNDQITCKLIRKYIHKYKKPSILNEHVPLIRKLITGITPPQFTENELQQIYILFIKIVKVYYIVKKPEANNVLYHPYFIFAIIKNIIPFSIRQTEILMCIHLQSRQTLVKNDKILKEICKYIPELKYSPTDRNLYN